MALATFYEVLVLNWASLHRTEEILGVDRGWEELVAWDTHKHFSTAPGRRWLKAWIDEGSPSMNNDMQKEIKEFVKDTARDEPANYYGSIYELLLAKD